jgi:hypothetical protein
MDISEYGKRGGLNSVNEINKIINAFFYQIYSNI